MKTGSNRKGKSVTELFRLMLEHPNPVTRSVYRELYMKAVTTSAEKKVCK